jgi:peptidoglycan DL-endopeptidase CwlO
MSGSVRSGAEAPKVRRNWLAAATLAAAVSVPVVALSPAAQAAQADQAAPAIGQQKAGIPAAMAASKTLKKPETHKAIAPENTVPKNTVPKNTVPKKPATASDKDRRRRPATFDHQAAALAKTLVGDPYYYGGTSPAGFDCSGLTQYVYARAGRGRSIQRTAEAQFLEFRPISQRTARPGDLVFFHVDSDPDSYVYHVGVYEGGDMMVAATTWGQGVQYQNFSWAGDTVTFGTITH